MALECEICGEVADNIMQLKNGAWAIEPLETYEIDPQGHICASWDGQYLDVWFHNRDQLNKTAAEHSETNHVVGYGSNPIQAVKSKIPDRHFKKDTVTHIDLKYRVEDDVESDGVTRTFENVSIPKTGEPRHDILLALEAADEKLTSNQIGVEIGYTHVSSKMYELYESRFVDREKAGKERGGLEYKYWITSIGKGVLEYHRRNSLYSTSNDE